MNDLIEEENVREAVCIPGGSHLPMSHYAQMRIGGISLLNHPSMNVWAPNMGPMIISRDILAKLPKTNSRNKTSNFNSVFLLIIT